MKKRLITAVFGLAVLTPVLLFSDTLVLPIAVGLFCAIGVWEMLGCIGTRKFLGITIPSLTLAAAIPLLVRPTREYFRLNAVTITIIGVMFFVYMYYMMCLTVTSKGQKPILDVSLTFMMTLYIITGFTSIIMIRDAKYGQYWFLLVFLGAWITDGAAYFVGRALGKHKLIPDVSPKKTIEGAVGGSIFCAITFVIFGIIAERIGGVTMNLPGMIIAGLLISVISQFGDLIASLIKRHYGIKDYGILFPGHGGVMDRFDSIIAIAPFLMMLCADHGLFALLI